jgi:hypothetical protein
MSFRVQEFIHKWEVGVGQRIVKVTAAVLAFVGLAVWYDLRVFTGLSTPEGLDAAQLARNVSRGEGFTTRFIRPFSLHLLHRNARNREGASTGDVAPANKQLKLPLPHPDLANAPAYPALLAGVLKIMPFDYPVDPSGGMAVYGPDLWIAGFNQLLFLIVLVLGFRLARFLFDEPVAWISVMLMAGTELWWHLTGTGHSTLLLMAVVLGTITVLAKADRLVRSAGPDGTSRYATLLLPCLAGLLVGVATLTRYSAAVLILPVVGWLGMLSSPGPTLGPGEGVLAGGQRKTTMAFLAAFAFCIVVMPWVIRNYTLSGTAFGTAGYSFAADTGYFAGDELERSLNPDLNRIEPRFLWRKVIENAARIVRHQLPSFAGPWVTALFLAGLLVPFRNPTLGRVRWLVVTFAVALLLAQAAGQTHLSKETSSGATPISPAPLLSSENLLVAIAPAAVIFGTGFLSVLLQGLTGPALRFTATGLLVVLVWMPLLVSLTSFHAPIHYPPGIQERALSIGERDLVMSDVPWAMAWYGDRNSVWLTLQHREPSETGVNDTANSKLGNDFYSMHRVLPISALHMAGGGLQSIHTADVADWRTATGREGDDWTEFLGEASGLVKRLDTPERKEEVETLRRLLQLADRHWAYGDDRTWAGFLLGIYINTEVPTGFPLKRAPFGLWPELFLTGTEQNSTN